MAENRRKSPKMAGMIPGECWMLKRSEQCVIIQRFNKRVKKITSGHEGEMTQGGIFLLKGAQGQHGWIPDDGMPHHHGKQR